MPKAQAKLQMLMEQGYLCAYTMQQISTPDDCHIEHVVPRNQSLDLQISYSNLLACAPGDTPGHRPRGGKYPFGAQEKGGTLVNENNFVSPLQGDVELRFQYAGNGSITHLDDDAAAKNTIKILRLDHGQLLELRKAAIEERVWDADLSAPQAEELSRRIMTADGDGRIPEFCVAISQVALWYAARTREVN